MGLIFVLLLVYLGIEWKTYASQDVNLDQISMGEIDEEFIPITELPTPPSPKLPTPPEIIEVVPDDPNIIEDPIESTESSQETIIDIKKLKRSPKMSLWNLCRLFLLKMSRYIQDVKVYPIIMNEKNV